LAEVCKGIAGRAILTVMKRLDEKMTRDAIADALSERRKPKPAGDGEKKDDSEWDNATLTNEIDDPDDELNAIEPGDMVDVDIPTVGVVPVRVQRLVGDVNAVAGPPDPREPDVFVGPGFYGEIDPNFKYESGEGVFSLNQVVPGSKAKYYFPSLGTVFLGGEGYDDYGRAVQNPYRKMASQAMRKRETSGDLEEASIFDLTPPPELKRPRQGRGKASQRAAITAGGNPYGSMPFTADWTDEDEREHRARLRKMRKYGEFKS